MPGIEEFVELVSGCGPEVELRLASPAGALFYTRVTGYLDDTVAQRIIERGEHVIARHGRLLGFHDWGAVSGYSTAARLALITWGLRSRHSIDRVHLFLPRSTLGDMMISLATSALGAMCEIHRNREDFETLLTITLQRLLHTADA